MTIRKRLLIASAPDGRHRAKQALSNDYDLKFASTLFEAKQILREDYNLDMIIVGIHFDDSRMFELLEFVRSVNRFDSIPFLVIQAQDSNINVMEMTRTTAGKLGACGFVELQQLPPAEANRLLQKTVQELL